ncbi:MAG: insulinase family protein, partial [Anaerolineae bacterium]|nr:insulinase family protein [Anaerolineae bacterium]
SLNTFLNAMTFGDKTCYPVASQNLQDFYNLVDVYLDAVFYPRLTPEILAQEGWHYELEDVDDAGAHHRSLVYKGVVFNEMKGAYASPDSLIGRYGEQVLFPDTIYSNDSGGDPEVIPNLTYEQFRSFHRLYYHPSNARFFFYGDDDPEERLRLLDEYLRDFSALPIDSAISLQPRLSEPRHVVYPYPAGEDQASKAMVTVNWMLPVDITGAENNQPIQTLALNILSHVLVGTPASPLRKALIDSGLGEDVIGGGLDESLRQLTFSVGLKGVDPANVDRVAALIHETLATLAEEGLEREQIEASINTVEFQLREQNTGSYPRGLFVMLQALTTWLHDGDPFTAIAFESSLREIKTEWAEQSRYFESLIQAHLLDNSHQATVVLTPDLDLQDRQEAAERARLAAIKAEMDEEDIGDVITRAQHLKALQETPDPPEALATIPSLRLEDLDAEPKVTPTEVVTYKDTKVLYHDLFTNGILYLDVGFDLRALPQDLLPYAALFTAGLLELGTETEDFVKLTQRIGRKTGGIRPGNFTSMIRDTRQAAAWTFLRGKATVAQAEDLLAILRDILLTVNLDNPSRFAQMVLERKARKEASLIPRGHAVVATRLRAKFSESHWVDDEISGVDYLFFLRNLADEVTSDWSGVLGKLEAVRKLLINRSQMVCNVTLDEENWAKVAPKLDGFLASLPAAPVSTVTWTPALPEGPEALTLPASVNYVAKGANLFDLGYELDGSTEVIAHYLRSTWLWERVRVQGGAYGGFALFDAHSGTFGYVSYRDPNLVQTLDIYDQTADFLANLDLSQDELVKGIIGAIGNLDAYQLPDARGYSAMARYLIGYTDEARQAYRAQVLGTTVEDFRAFAEVLRRVADAGEIVVLGSASAVEAAEEVRSLGFEMTRVL